MVYDLDLKSKRESVSVNTQGTSFKKDLANFESSVSDIKSVNDFLRQSFVDGEVPRLKVENKVENKDTGAITYNRSFNQEKTPENVNLERKLS